MSRFRCKIDSNSRQREIVVDTGIAVAENGIVTAHTLELVERTAVAGVSAPAAEANRRVGIVELRTAN